MSDETPRLKLSATPEGIQVTADIWSEQLRRIDAFVDLYLKGLFVNTPPVSPQDGDAYVIGGTPDWPWSQYPYWIAYCVDGGWGYSPPYNGLRAYVEPAGTFVMYRDGVWFDLSALISAGEKSFASGPSCDLGAAASLFVEITGDTAITSFGTAANTLRFVRFAQALTLTHNATSLILLGGGNRTTAAGDVGVYTSDASGDWRERAYFRAASNPGDTATKSGTETFSNKTLASPALSGTTILPGSGSINSSGWLGIGAAPSHPVHVTRTSITSGGGTQAAGYFNNSASTTGLTGTNTLIGVRATSYLSGTITSGSTVIQGVQGSAGASGGGAIGEIDGLSFIVYNDMPSGSISAVVGTFSAFVHRGASSIDTLYGITYKAALSGGTGTIGVAYDLYLDSSPLNACITNHFGIYQAGSDSRNYFAGRIGLGASDPLTGCVLDAAGNIYPHAAASYNLGSPSYYWANGYMQNAWTVVSDQSLKDEITALSEAEMSVAKAIAPLIAVYKMKSAVAAKGSAAARKHCGWIAQRIEAVFTANGLDPFAYGCIGFDPAVKTVTQTRTVKDENGNDVEETYDSTEPDLDENGVQKKIYSIRPDEVSAFALAGLAARIAALETA